MVLIKGSSQVKKPSKKNSTTVSVGLSGMISSMLAILHSLDRMQIIDAHFPSNDINGAFLSQEYQNLGVLFTCTFLASAAYMFCTIENAKEEIDAC